MNLTKKHEDTFTETVLRGLLSTMGGYIELRETGSLYKLAIALLDRIDRIDWLEPEEKCELQELVLDTKSEVMRELRDEREPWPWGA